MKSKVIAPNNLPLTVLRQDGTRLEHEHAEHPTYMFPIWVEFTGEKPADLHEHDTSYHDDYHAVIYTDGVIVLTLDEYCYQLFYLSDGTFLKGSSWYNESWRIRPDDLMKIKQMLDKQEKLNAK